MLELPKKISTVKYKDNILTIDNNQEIELQSFTPEIMKQLGGYASIVGFYLENYPLTDELLEPLRGLKKLVNVGIIGGRLTDQSFAIFASMPKLQYLWLEGNVDMTGSGLALLRESKINALDMKHTALDDKALLLAAELPKLSYLHVDDTLVTFDGILAVADNQRIKICSKTLFSVEQLDAFSAAQRMAGKKKLTLDQQAAAQATEILQRFFDAMTAWEIMAYQNGITSEGLQESLQQIFDMYVSEKPRRGYRPLGLSAEANGTYHAHKIIDAEQVTKNKLYLYTKNSSGSQSTYRFLMRNVNGSWKVDHAQVHWDGWQRWGL